MSTEQALDDDARQAFHEAVERIERQRAEMPRSLFDKPVVTDMRPPDFDRLTVVDTGYFCDICFDTGWKIRADGGAGAATPCTCRVKTYDRPESIPAAALEAYGCVRSVSGKLKSTWDPAYGEWPEEADYWPGRCISDGERPKWLLLHGVVGNGKSRVAAWIMRRAMARGRSCWWLDVPAAIEEARKAIGSIDAQLSLNSKMAAIMGRQVVILDDVGAHRGDSAWQVEDLFASWVRSRHESGGWTVATTNLDESQLREFHERSASRMMSGPVVKMTGGDARRREWSVE